MSGWLFDEMETHVSRLKGEFLALEGFLKERDDTIFRLTELVSDLVRALDNRLDGLKLLSDLESLERGKLEVSK